MNEENNQTSTEDTLIVNPQETITEPTANIDNDTADIDIDYKTKFSESAKEAQRLFAKKRELEIEVEQLRSASKSVEQNGTSYSDNPNELIPGFDSLSKEEQDNLLAYTDSIRRTTLDAIYKDPAIADSKKRYNESVWIETFESVADEYPELKNNKEDFKAKYFKADNAMPSNIKDITRDLAKIYLFDKASDIGARKATEEANRIDIERTNGGDKAPTEGRTIEDWQKLSISNPVKFAQEYKKYNDGLSK